MPSLFQKCWKTKENLANVISFSWHFNIITVRRPQAELKIAIWKLKKSPTWRRTCWVRTFAESAGRRVLWTDLSSTLVSAPEVSSGSTRSAWYNGCATRGRNSANSAATDFPSPRSTVQTCQEDCHYATFFRASWPVSTPRSSTGSITPWLPLLGSESCHSLLVEHIESCSAAPSTSSKWVDFLGLKRAHPLFQPQKRFGYVHVSLFHLQIMALPMEILSPDNISSDVFHGCFVVTCTLIAFIGLVWLREQILHAGGPDWIERNADPPINNLDQPLQNDAQLEDQRPMGHDNNNVPPFVNEPLREGEYLPPDPKIVNQGY